MKNLDQVPTQQLLKELADRGLNIPRPEPIKNPDLSELISTTEQYMEFVESDNYHEDNDYNVYIAEATLKALYGDNVYTWINGKTQ